MNVLERRRPNIRFSSLAGIKDLVLKSTDAPIPLLHMEWGETQNADNIKEPQENFLHMWCLRDNDHAINLLKVLGITPKATGLILHHRLGHIDWSELRTSEL